jgi:hypothetical protein
MFGLTLRAYIPTTYRSLNVVMTGVQHDHVAPISTCLPRRGLGFLLLAIAPIPYPPGIYLARPGPRSCTLRLPHSLVLRVALDQRHPTSLIFVYDVQRYFIQGIRHPRSQEMGECAVSRTPYPQMLTFERVERLYRG